MVADIEPLEILWHLPLLAEDKLCPIYLYLQNKDLDEHVESQNQ